MVDAWHDRGQLVGRWDDGARLFVATGWTYGPAGPASVDLAPGLRFAVDFADPDVTTEITIEAPLDGDPARLDPRAERAARMLLGPPTLRTLLALARPGASDHAVTIVEASRREELTAGMQRRALGRFTVLAEMTTEARVSRLGVAIAGLEAASVAPTVDPGMGVMLTPARALARDGAETLLALVDAGELDASTLHPSSDPARVLRAAMPVLGDEVLARRLRGLADGARDQPARALTRFTRVAPRKDAAHETAEAAMAAPSAAPDRLDHVVEVDDPAEPGTSAFLVGTEVRVRGPRPARREERWARVFRRRGRLLLALAPLRANDVGVDAVLVVPPGLDARELLIDVTHAPETPRASEALGAVRAAVAAGRDACRLERLGDTGAAALRWSECADRWDAVGDAPRAALARRYASGGRDDRRIPSRRVRGLAGQPFVADRLV